MPDAKQMFSITQWENEKTVGAPFSAMLNPSGYSNTRVLNYGAIVGGERKCGAVPAEVLKLEELVFDGTGVVNTAAPQSVDAQVKALAAVVYDLPAPAAEGAVAKRPVVLLLWGSLYFVGRLKSMTVKYTLFRSDGAPLRARVALEFIAYEKVPPAHDAAADYTLTKQLQVNADATLPLMCFQAYQSPVLVAAVALANGLTSFRNLAVGQVLNFPPA